jgi:hypothetical protein
MIVCPRSFKVNLYQAANDRLSEPGVSRFLGRVCDIRDSVPDTLPGQTKAWSSFTHVNCFVEKLLPCRIQPRGSKHLESDKHIRRRKDGTAIQCLGRWVN